MAQVYEEIVYIMSRDNLKDIIILALDTWPPAIFSGF